MKWEQQPTLGRRQRLDFFLIKDFWWGSGERPSRWKKLEDYKSKERVEYKMRH